MMLIVLLLRVRRDQTPMFCVCVSERALFVCKVSINSDEETRSQQALNTQEGEDRN